MSLSHSKPWYSVVDIDSTTLSLDMSTVAKANASSMWVLKQLLKAGSVGTGTLGWTGAVPGTAHWSVIGSSDGATAGLDGVDRWSNSFDTTKLVTGLSWIVLQHPVATGWYIQLGCNTIATNGVDVRMYYQPGGPTGGSTTAIPTWTAAPINSNYADGYVQYAFASTATRYQFTTDANGCFWFGSQSTGKGAWMQGFQQLVNGPSTDTNPYMFCGCNNIDSYRTFISTTQVNLGISANVGSYVSGVGAIALFNAGTRTIAASTTVDGTKYLRGPVTLWPTSTAQYYDPKGNLPDVYQGFYADAFASVPSTGNCYFAMCNGPITSINATIVSAAGGLYLPFTARPTSL